MYVPICETPCSISRIRSSRPPNAAAGSPPEMALARHRDEQAALYQLTDSLFRATSLSGACDAALDAIRRALGCGRAFILLLDDADQMKFVAWRGLSEEYRRAVEGHSPWPRDVKEPQPICVSDVETSDMAEDLKATVRAEGLAALAFIPLVANGELVGKFMTYYEAPHAFRDAEIDLAVTIARQLGFSIERIRAEEVRRRGEELGMEVLVEVHDEAELERALAGGATLVGVNSRDLRTFEVSLDVCFRLATRIPKGIVAVAESGIRNATDLQRLQEAGFRGFLIGEQLMRAASPGTALAALRAHARVGGKVA